MKKILVVVLCLILICSAVAYAEVPAATTPEGIGFTVNLTELVLSIIALALNFLLAWLIKAVIPPIRRWLEAKTTSEQRQLLYSVIRSLVNAAEQTIGAGKGREKLDYVVTSLKKRGFDVDLDLIESAVREMNNASVAEIIAELRGDGQIASDEETPTET